MKKKRKEVLNFLLPGIFIVLFTTTLIAQVPPAPGLSQTSDTRCTTENFSVSATGQPGAEFTWTLPDQSQKTGAEIQFNHPNLNQHGTYTVIQTVNGISSTQSAGYTLTLRQSPPAPIVSASPGATSCEGTTINITASGVAGAEVLFFDGTNFALQSTKELTNVTAADAGIYSFVQRIDGCTSDAGTVDIIVKQNPIKPAIKPDPANGCTGQVFQFNIANDFIGGTKFKWRRGDQIISNQTRAFILREDVSEHTITVTSELDGCFVVSDPVILKINQTPPPPVITIAEGLSICAGTSLHVTVSGLEEGAQLAFEIPGRQTETRTEFVIENMTSGQGFLECTQTVNGCTSAATSKFVDIKQTPRKPVIEITKEGEHDALRIENFRIAICEGTALEFNTTFGSTEIGFNRTYTLTGPDNFSKTSSPPVELENLLPTHNGNFTLTVDIAGCKSVSDPVSIRVVSPPAPSITFDRNPVCANSRVEITLGNVLPSARLIWETNLFPLNTTSLRFTVDAGNAGIKNIKLKQEIRKCVSPITSVDLVVNNPPARFPAFFTSKTPNTPLCPGDNASLHASFPLLSIPGTRFIWTGPNGFKQNGPDIQLNDVKTTNAGIYRAKLDVKGCLSPQSPALELDVRSVRIEPIAANDPICPQPQSALLNLFIEHNALKISNSPNPAAHLNGTRFYYAVFEYNNLPVRAVLINNADLARLMDGTTTTPRTVTLLPDAFSNLSGMTTLSRGRIYFAESKTRINGGLAAAQNRDKLVQISNAVCVAGRCGN